MKLNRILLGFIVVLVYNFSAFAQCTWSYYNTSNSGLPDMYINDIAIDQNDHAWFTTSFGVVEFDGDTTWTLYNTITTGSGLPDDYTNIVIADADNNIWISHSAGVSRYTGTAWTTYNTGNSPLSGDFIQDICPDHMGNVWFTSSGSKSGGVSFFNNNTSWQSYNLGNTPNLVSDEISNISIDIHEDIWLSSGDLDSGITRFDGTNWMTYPMADTIPLSSVQFMETDMNGNIWLNCSGSNGILKYDGSSWTRYNSQNSILPSNYVSCIETDHLGNVWFGTYDGAVRFDGDTTWTLYNTQNGLPDNDVSNIAVDRKGFVYFSTYSGVARLNTNAVFHATVSYNGSILDSTDVYIELYSADISGSNGQDSLMGIIGHSVLNEFTLDNITPGNYYLKANKKSTSAHTNMIDSYYALNDTTYYWQHATIFSLSECELQSFLINMYEMSGAQTGSGIFSGTIAFYSGTKGMGEPVPGAEVYIEQEPNDEPAYVTETDSSGDYTITGIAEGSGYSIFIDLPGFPLIETYDSLEITLANNDIYNLDFYVDNTGIYIYDASGVIEINENAAINIFPNPSNDRMTINYTLLENSKNVKISLIDQYGRIINSIDNNSQPAGEYSYDLNKNSYGSGSYYLHFRIDDKNYIKKLIFIDK